MSVSIISRFLAGCTGTALADVEVDGLRRLAGGASREIWALVARVAGRDYDLVMRRDPPGRDEGDRNLEFQVVQAAHRAGVPVPRPHWACDDPTVLGSRFYLMDRIDGEALPRRLLRDPEYAQARGCMTGQLARILARIHEIDPGVSSEFHLFSISGWNASVPGRLQIDSSTDGGAGVNGSGYLAKVHFHVIGAEGQKSPITLDTSQSWLKDAAAGDISVTWGNDSVTVVP